jgi:hypothetical protein
VTHQPYLAGVADHALSYRTSPLYRQAFCSCGWQGSVPRRQNAWAATSKLKAQVRAHLKASASVEEIAKAKTEPTYVPYWARFLERSDGHAIL